MWNVVQVSLDNQVLRGFVGGAFRMPDSSKPDSSFIPLESVDNEQRLVFKDKEPAAEMLECLTVVGNNFTGF